MVMNVVINPVAPGIAPAVDLEEIFENGCRIQRVWKRTDAAINNQRPMGMIGNQAVVCEAEGMCFARTHQRREFAFRRSVPASGFLGDRLVLSSKLTFGLV